MKTVSFALLSLCCAGFDSLRAQSPVVLDVTGTSAEHQLQWTTELGFNYHVFLSTDLDIWTDTGIVEPGCDGVVGYRFAPDPVPTELYYQIRASVGSSFLILPCQWEEATLSDGVCFAFDLNTLATDPAEVRISTRPIGSPGGFDVIGTLTDFDEVNGFKFLAGSVVWIPQSQGEYECLVEAFDESDALIISDNRFVSVSANLPPTITIDGVIGNPGPSPLAVEGETPARFLTTVGDPDLLGHPAFRQDDAVRRVEFYDDGILLGTDFSAPFGDLLLDLEGLPLFTLSLLLGNHPITAIAYDRRGGIGYSQTFDVTVTHGSSGSVNQRPNLSITSAMSPTVVRNEEFTITVSVEDDGDIVSISAQDIMFGGARSSADLPSTDIEMDTTGWPLGVHTIEVLAWDDESDHSYPQYVHVEVVESLEESFAEELAAIITDASAQASNARFQGMQLSSDQFLNGTQAGLAFNEGILLTTGLFGVWDSGNTGSETETIWNTVGDRALEDRIAGTYTLDAATLEFNVSALNGQLEFRVQFGSEEYIEYVDDSVEFGCKNDAFIIAINDVVVSYVPDCSEIVSVNTVHPSISYLESSCLVFPQVLPAENEHIYLSNITQVEYDGLTRPLKFHVLVGPGQHHVRIAIADVDDYRFDSGLFIGAGSVRTIQP